MSAKTKTEFEKQMEQQEDDAIEFQKSPTRLADDIDKFLSHKMPATKMDSFSRVYRDQIEAEIKRRADQKAADEQHALDIFGDQFTPEEMEAGKSAMREFVPRYPKYLRNPENLRILLAEVEARRQFVREENLSAAYQTLLTRKAFIEPAADPVISAAEYLRQHSELRDSQIPALARESVERALNSFIQSHREYIASNRNFVALDRWLSELELPITFSNLEAAYQGCRNAGLLELNDDFVGQHGSTTLVDYGPRQAGYPKESEKYSFKKLVRDLTADELKQRMLDDPSFERGLDALNK